MAVRCFPRLEYLQVNVQHCEHPLTYTGVLDEGMEALLVGPWVSMPKRIEFVGVVTQDDDERITRNWISIFEARTSTLTMEDTQSEFKALEW